MVAHPVLLLNTLGLSQPSLNGSERESTEFGYTWSSGRAPLLAPSPLRTGLEGFPFIRLEHPKNAPMKNEDAARFKTNQTYSILTCCRFARRWKIHRSCVKLHQRVAPSSFALLHASVPQEFLELSTNRKSAPFPAR